MVIGIGNEYRGDDGVGRIVARRIAALGIAGVSVCEASGESLTLMELWRGAGRVLLVDALKSGAEPGTVMRMDAGSAPLPAEFVQQCSTHALSLAEAVELARSLGQLPPEVVIYGIEGLSFEHGNRLTPTVARAAEEAVERIGEELSKYH